MKLSVAALSLAVIGSTAFAQPAAKPAPPSPPATAVPPPDKAPVAPPQPAMPPKPPTPPQEIIDLGKAMAGTWKCTGSLDLGGTKLDIKATITHKVDTTLNKFWIVSNFTGTAAKLPPMKFTMYTGYDNNSKKLFRMSANSMGGHNTTTATYDAKKIMYEGDASGAFGVSKVRNTEEMISPKEVHVSGEVSKDNGKTWAFDHDATCKK
jgi:hypothetical protein